MPPRKCRSSPAGQTDLPNSFDQLGATLENAALLRKAGVTVALTTGGENNFRVRSLRQHAGNAVANGLPWDQALRAVTLSPAEIFGVADKMGSLQAGREANVVVWDGDPFELSTRVDPGLRPRPAVDEPLDESSCWSSGISGCSRAVTSVGLPSCPGRPEVRCANLGDPSNSGNPINRQRQKIKSQNWYPPRSAMAVADSSEAAPLESRHLDARHLPAGTLKA